MAKTLTIALWVFVAVHIFFNIHEWYWAYRWLDSVMHFIGGGIVAALGVYCYGRCGVIVRANGWVGRVGIVVLILSFVSFIGVLWEFHEFIADLFIKDPVRIMQAGASDSMSDLFFGLLGGSMFLLCQAFCTRPLLSTEAKN